MRIGIDIMGGDFAPKETVLGAISAQNELSPKHQVILIGGKDAIVTGLKEADVPSDHFEIVDAPEIIQMGEHPTKAIFKKQNSSIATGFRLLKEKTIDAFVGAGNTGAMMVGAMYSVKSVPGIIRPSITSHLPKENGGFGIILDVGANADCKPDVLYQFAIMGSLYAHHIYNIKNPKVALLNIGEESEKGNLLTQATYHIMKDNSEINFVGNIEGRDLFNGKADVIVCDGFTGNVVLKEAESFYNLIKKRGIKDDYFERFNYETYGGCPILGINAPVVVGHGISKAPAIKNMIMLAVNLTLASFSEKLKKSFN